MVAVATLVGSEMLPAVPLPPGMPTEKEVGRRGTANIERAALSGNPDHEVAL